MYMRVSSEFILHAICMLTLDCWKMVSDLKLSPNIFFIMLDAFVPLVECLRRAPVWWSICFKFSSDICAIPILITSRYCVSVYYAYYVVIVFSIKFKCNIWSSLYFKAAFDLRQSIYCCSSCVIVLEHF